MLKIEKKFHDRLIFILDEPCSLSYLQTDALSEIKNLNELNKEEQNLKTLEFIRYLLENEIIEVGENWINFAKWELNIEQTLIKINEMLKHGDSIELIMTTVDLTPTARLEINDYLNKLILIEKKVLLKCENLFLNIQDIILIVKEVFQTNDPKEIEYIFSKSIGALLDRGFMKMGIFIYYGFDWQDTSDHLLEKIKTVEPEKEFINQNRICFKITKMGKKVKEWKNNCYKFEDYYQNILSLGDGDYELYSNRTEFFKKIFLKIKSLFIGKRIIDLHVKKQIKAIDALKKNKNQN